MSAVTTSAAHSRRADQTLNANYVHSATNKTSNKLVESVNQNQMNGIIFQNRHSLSKGNSVENMTHKTAATITSKHRPSLTPTVKRAYSTPTKSPVSMETVPLTSKTDFMTRASDPPFPTSNTEIHTPPTHSQMTVETDYTTRTTVNTATSDRTVFPKTPGSTPSTTATSTVTAPSAKESKQTVQVISICTTVGLVSVLNFNPFTALIVLCSCHILPTAALYRLTHPPQRLVKLIGRLYFSHSRYFVFFYINFFWDLNESTTASTPIVSLEGDNEYTRYYSPLTVPRQ